MTIGSIDYNDLDFYGALNRGVSDKLKAYNAPSVGSLLDTTETNRLSGINTSLFEHANADYLTDPAAYDFGLGFGSVPGLDTGSFTPSFADKFWGYKDPKTGMMYDGYAKTGLGAVQAGLGFYLGKGQLDQAKKALRENQRQFNTNYAAQRAIINDQLRWQHRARMSADPTYKGQLTQIA